MNIIIGHKMNKFFIAIFLIITFLLTGCAHKATIDTTNIKFPNVNKINATAAYNINNDLKLMQIITGGGGGDSVSYFLYRDMEAGINTVLMSIFQQSYSIKDFKDTNSIKSKNIKYVFKPSFKSYSSSSSLVFWPPTYFRIDLNYTVYDGFDNKILFEGFVYGEGHANASFDEFSRDLMIASRRASENLFLNFQNDVLSKFKGLK